MGAPENEEPVQRNEPVLQPDAEDPTLRDITSALCADIFRLTGRKVAQDDPIVLVALVQSSLMQRASQQAATTIHQATAQTVQALTGAVSVERQHAAALDAKLAGLLQLVCDTAKQACEQEAAACAAQFARTAAAVLEKVHKETAAATPAHRRWRLVIGFALGLSAGLAGGVWLAASRGSVLSNEQIRLLHNGVLLDQAWPKLPAASRRLFGSDQPVVAPRKPVKPVRPGSSP